MKKFFVIAILMIVVLSTCGISTPAASPTPAPVVAQATMVPTTAPAPTEVPATATSAPTVAASPTEVPATATSAPTGSVAVTAPQEWDGNYRQAESGHSIGIQLFIKKITGSTFTGTMWWRYFAQPVTETKVQGDIITDIASATEQTRWAFNKDFNTDKSGTWLRWTETDFVVGPGYHGLNGWYYAHLRSDGQLLGIYFDNAKVSNPEPDLYFLTLPNSSVPAPTP